MDQADARLVLAGAVGVVGEDERFERPLGEFARRGDGVGRRAQFDVALEGDGVRVAGGRDGDRVGPHGYREVLRDGAEGDVGEHPPPVDVHVHVRRVRGEVRDADRRRLVAVRGDTTDSRDRCDPRDAGVREHLPPAELSVGHRQNSRSSA